MSSPIGRFELKLTALAAPSAALLTAALLAGCLNMQVRSILPLVTERGAHGVGISKARIGLRYSVVSVLPGKRDDASCDRAEPRPLSGITTVACGGVEPADVSGVQDRLERALAKFKEYFPWIGLRRVEIRLYPDGVKHVLVSRGLSSPDQLAFEMAMRAPGQDQVHHRALIRTFVHELTHFAEWATRGGTNEDSEFLASVAETCVEHSVFGSSRGYAFESEIYGEDFHAFDARQRESIRGARKAYEAMVVYIENDGDKRALDAYCREVLLIR